MLLIKIALHYVNTKTPLTKAVIQLALLICSALYIFIVITHKKKIKKSTSLVVRCNSRTKQTAGVKFLFCAWEQGVTGVSRRGY